MEAIKSFHRSISTSDSDSNHDDQVRPTTPSSRQWSNHYCPSHLITIAFSLLCFMTIRNNHIVEADSDYGSYDENQLGGDLDLFKITWPGPYQAHQTEVANMDQAFHISTKDNEHYICIDPPLHSKNELHSDFSARNSSSENSKTPLQLLGPLLRSNSCSYKFDLFWIYELCHGKFLRQYHEESGRQKAKVTQEYYLGKMDHDQIELHEEEYEREMVDIERSGQSLPTILVNGVYKPYVVVNMTMGTKCDLTKRNRVARIVYVCNEEPSLVLYSIKEISTCEYEAIVLSPHLCLHRDFKIDTATQHEVRCFSKNSESPNQPKRVKDFHAEDEDLKPKTERVGQRTRGLAYLQGRTLIIDADLLLS